MCYNMCYHMLSAQERHIITSCIGFETVEVVTTLAVGDASELEGSCYCCTLLVSLFQLNSNIEFE